MDHNTRGDLEQRFAEIYLREYEELRLCAIRLMRALGAKVDVEGRAEDAVQEAVATAWKKLDEMFSKESPVNWLYATLRRKVREIMKDDYRWTRKLKKISVYTGYTESRPDWELRVEMSDLISESEYSLLHRRYIEKYSYQELCQELNISKPALAMRLKRAKDHFIENFEK